MSIEVDGDSQAFPIPEGSHEVATEGMTIRTYLAAKAMQALLSIDKYSGDPRAADWLVADAVETADLLIAELNKATK